MRTLRQKKPKAAPPRAPSPERIAAACSKIQASWSKREERARRGVDRKGTDDYWTPPLVALMQSNELPEDG